MNLVGRVLAGARNAGTKRIVGQSLESLVRLWMLGRSITHWNQRCDSEDSLFNSGKKMKVGHFPTISTILFLCCRYNVKLQEWWPVIAVNWESKKGCDLQLQNHFSNNTWICLWAQMMIIQINPCVNNNYLFVSTTNHWNKPKKIEDESAPDQIGNDNRYRLETK